MIDLEEIKKYILHFLPTDDDKTIQCSSCMYYTESDCNKKDKCYANEAIKLINTLQLQPLQLKESDFIYEDEWFWTDGKTTISFDIFEDDCSDYGEVYGHYTISSELFYIEDKKLLQDYKTQKYDTIKAINQKLAEIFNAVKGE